MATILNTLKARNLKMMITLVPQTANIAATPDFDDVWANYAVLISLTYNVLDWVVIQLYNPGVYFASFFLLVWFLAMPFALISSEAAPAESTKCAITR